LVLHLFIAWTPFLASRPPREGYAEKGSLLKRAM